MFAISTICGTQLQGMSMHDGNPGSLEELQKLSREIATLREQIVGVSNALNRIEKRLLIVFPQYEKRKKFPKHSGAEGASTKTREELLSIFEELLGATRTGGDGGFSMKIAQIAPGDLTALAYELGATDRRKVGVAKATDGVKRRIQESLLLGSPVSQPSANNKVEPDGQ